jgi:hypothetical protein
MGADEPRYVKRAPGDEVPPGTEGAGEDVCQACGGSGERDGALCAECEGTGRVTRGVGGG